MPWVIQKVADYGTSNQNIARVVIQTDEILGFTTLSKVERESLIMKCHQLSHRLANAEAAAKDVSSRSKAAFDNLKDDHDRGVDTVEIPYLPNLEIIFEGFFYNAKNIVRDLGGIVGHVYGRRFEDASDWCAFGKKAESEVSKFFRRLANEHPAHSTVRQLVENSREGIEVMVRIRNALEHPGKAAGTVVVKNFRPHDGGIANPAFAFEGEAIDYDLALSMSAFHDMLLNLTEAVLVFGLMLKFAIPGLGVRHIVPEKRDPAKPVAFRVVRVSKEMEVQSKPFDGRPA